MSLGRFTVEFVGEIPEGLSVGDVLEVSGRGTVQQITADLVDITSLGDKPTFTLGGVGVFLTANEFKVERA